MILYMYIKWFVISGIIKEKKKLKMTTSTKGTLKAFEIHNDKVLCNSQSAWYTLDHLQLQWQVLI